MTAMMKSKESIDLALALELHQRLNSVGVTENAIPSKNGEGKDYQPRTLIDNTLELIDPTPNIFTLFVQFNTRFFWNKLLPVEVKWSNKMTSCAGVCSFHPRNRQCIISLSAPLLKLRPRKDLVETLLHEMIHGYLFLTNNDRDRDGHGPEFHKHMYRINKEAGTNISVYHNFHDEVRLYQQHWWRCDGPCQKRPPYFGTVRRAMNRAPGPRDFWWSEHQRTCGGQFIKVREPEKPPAKTKNSVSGKKKSEIPKSKNILDWFTKSADDMSPKSANPVNGAIGNGTGKDNHVNRIPDSSRSNDSGGNTLKKTGSNTKNLPSQNSSNAGTFNFKKPNIPTHSAVNANAGTSSDTSSGNSIRKVGGFSNTKVNNPTTSLNKLGNSANNVHGWGTAGPNSGTSASKLSNPTKNSPKFNCTGTLGGTGSGKSNLLDKFSSRETGIRTSTPNHVRRDLSNNATPQKRKNSGEEIQRNKEPKLETGIISKSAKCPVCDILVSITELNDHLDECLIQNSGEKHSTPKQSNDSFLNDNSLIIIDDSSDTKAILGSPIVLDSSDSSSSFSADSPAKMLSNGSVSPVIERETRKCLVCNSVIDRNVTLNDHLEACIGVAFSDESMTDDPFVNGVEVEEDDTIDKKFPCPICMELIIENHMNQHLDTCLSTDLLKNYT